MRLSVNKIRDYFEVVFIDNNIKVESGLLDDEEFLELQKNNLAEMLYHDSDELWRYIAKEYKRELEDYFKEE